MTYIALVEAFLILVLLVLVYSLESSNARERSDRAAAYEKTLQQMANRIQHPEHVPTAGSEPYVLPEREPEPDGWNEVGTITIDPEYVSE